MFLKNARSLLKIDGKRTLFLGRFPIWPVAQGFRKQAVLKARGVPVGSVPKSPFIGSQMTNGLALFPPPVKSVIGVQTCVSPDTEVSLDPTGQGETLLIVAAVLL